VARAPSRKVQGLPARIRGKPGRAGSLAFSQGVIRKKGHAFDSARSASGSVAACCADLSAPPQAISASGCAGRAFARRAVGRAARSGSGDRRHRWRAFSTSGRRRQPRRSGSARCRLAPAAGRSAGRGPRRHPVPRHLRPPRRPCPRCGGRIGSSAGAP